MRSYYHLESISLIIGQSEKRSTLKEKKVKYTLYIRHSLRVFRKVYALIKQKLVRPKTVTLLTSSKHTPRLHDLLLLLLLLLLLFIACLTSILRYLVSRLWKDTFHLHLPVLLLEIICFMLFMREYEK
jgi:CDP-diglyceride synthetase